MGASLLARYGLTFLSFGAMQAMQFLLPLLALPWLGRVLGSEAFGLLMYMCLLPPLIALVMDWGLTTSGSREAALLRGTDLRLGALLGAALTAKFLLACLCLCLACLCWPWLPHAAQEPAGYWLAVLAGISRGLSPVWFCQGAARDVPVLACLDICASLLTLLMVFIFIQAPGQWPLYLLFLAISSLLVNCGMTVRLWLRYRPRPDLSGALKLLAASSTLAGSAMALLFCQNGGQLALGFLLPAPDMGLIVAVNKMLRSFAALLGPITQTLYPELCILAKRAPGQALRILRRSLLLVASAALTGAGLVWLMAPLLIELALGSQYIRGADVLRIAILAGPAMALEQAIASQVVIPCGCEKELLKLQACCAAGCLPLAWFLGQAFGLLGGASLAVWIELALLAGTGLIAGQALERGAQIKCMKR
ncbi:MAG: oligosaccharide flippase family protein [Desulfovibrio sp.]|nr:oligosaccharide flippase family protein [Desulfovibrio sp.]